MPVVVLGEVPDTSGKLSCQFPISFSFSLVIVEQTVDAPIPVQYVYSFGYNRSGIENNVILPVKVGHGRAVLHLQGEELKIIHHTLEHEAFLSLFSRLSDMVDILRGDASFEETVTHFIASCHILEPDGEIGFTVVDEVPFLTFSLCRCGVYSTLLQVTE